MPLIHFNESLFQLLFVYVSHINGVFPRETRGFIVIGRCLQLTACDDVD